MRHPPLPTGPIHSLTATSRRFEQWRRVRPRGERIPPALWHSALELARRHGVSKTSQALHLDYYSLQRRLAAAAVDTPPQEAPIAEQFVELALPCTTAPTSQCRLEILAHDGAAVRVELAGWSPLDLATFVQRVTGRGQP